MPSMPEINWDSAINWFCFDERDDFFPDMIRFRDFKNGAKSYCDINVRKIFQYSRETYQSFAVPKSLLLKRQASLMPLPFRIVYAGLFSTLFYEIAPYLDPGVHSYRMYPDVDHENKDYPFPSEATKSAWLGFKHGFNAALHEDGGQWGIITDITTFYERINIESMIGVLRDLVPPDRKEANEPCFELLQKALLWCSQNGWGVPQNYDPSSFFCSAFLTPVDRALSRVDGIHYSRWVDDIRITAPTRGAAISALHRLQDELSRFGLGVNAKKTILLEPGSEEFKQQISVDRDEQLHKFSELIAESHEESIRKIIPELTSLIKECDKNHDERFLRAFGSQFLKAGEFIELRKECLQAIRSYALEGFRSRPERADWWSKFLSPDVNEEVQNHLCDLISDVDFNIHDWTNQWAIITLSRAEAPTEKTRHLIRSISVNSSCMPIRANAITAMGKWEDNIERRNIADTYLTGHFPSILRRAAVIAIQELPPAIRDPYYEQAKNIDPDLNILVDYLSKSDQPRYHTYAFPNRTCAPTPITLPPPTQEGFGLVRGQWKRFKVRASYFIDYE